MDEFISFNGKYMSDIFNPGIAAPPAVYNGLTTVGEAFPVLLANIRTTGIAANQGATNFLASTPAVGTYLIVASLTVTSVFTTSGPLLTLGFTDSVGAQAPIVIPVLAVGVGSFGTVSYLLQSTGAAQITYAVTSGGTFGAAELNTFLARIA